MAAAVSKQHNVDSHSMIPGKEPPERICQVLCQPVQRSQVTALRSVMSWIDPHKLSLFVVLSQRNYITVANLLHDRIKQHDEVSCWTSRALGQL